MTMVGAILQDDKIPNINDHMAKKECTADAGGRRGKLNSNFLLAEGALFF